MVQPNTLWDIELEQSILGAILSDPAGFRVAASLVQQDHFYSSEGRRVFAACRSVIDGGGEVEFITVGQKLKSQGIDDIGIVRLSELASSNPTSANLEYLCKRLVGFALKRELLKLSAEISEQVSDSGLEAEEITANTRKRITDIATESVSGRSFEMPELVSRALKQIDELKASGKRWSGLTTGLVAIDNKLKGLKPGNMIVLAARPSMGKTALALNIARGVSRKEQKAVGIISLEMGADELVTRIISSESHVDSWRIQEAAIGREHQEKLNAAGARLSELKIIVQDEASIGISEFEAQAQILSLKHNICLLIVDYLQLFTPKTRDEKAAGTQQFTAMISKSMKNVARSLQIPVIALSQLSRAPELRGGDRRPMLSDLRDSGAIEQDADIVMFIYRPDYYKKESATVEIAGKSYCTDGLAEIIVAKHRNGPTGSLAMRFNPEFSEFVDYDTIHSGEFNPPVLPDEDKPF